ncbi:MAG: hypothetical protein KKC19_00955 [Nanoarchaeota archaeon]|nr:hypothetical protein [Nanoarchaeota archaeon]
MKKKVLASLFFLMFFVSFSLVSAQVNQSTEQEKINEAYSCLTDAVKNNCGTLTTEEKIFSLLSINQCKSELLEDSSNSGECWPKGNCNLKTTAQAILTLDKKGANTDKAKDWLLSQRKTPSEITWYLQITSNEQTNCQIEYSGLSYEITISEGGILAGNAGPGLSITTEGYWLQIFPSYSDKNFQISCDKSFLTNTLFKKEGSSTIHVSSESSSAAAGGITNEMIDSFCFAQNGVCNYEGSLWSVLALNTLDEEISPYLPYLITLAEDNQKFLPDAFLYSTTKKSDYLTTLLSKQIGNKWWAASSSGKFYDTSLALYSIQHETVSEKDSAKEWLLNEQESDGCWDSGNIRNTAFILLSAWPKNILSPSPGPSTLLCESSGNYCVPSGSCEGTIQASYSCPGLSSICCSNPYQEQSCSDLGGDICSSSEVCERGNLRSASDTTGRTCCVGDVCKVGSSVTPSTSQCTSSGGSCRIGGCLSNEDASSYLCSSSGETCCISQPSNKSNYTIIWIIGALIVLVILGIVFREKLRHLLLWIKSHFRKSGSNGPADPRGRFPPSVGSSGPSRPSYYPPRRHAPVERRILSQPHRPVPRHIPEKPKSGTGKELDDVLKKLKEMGK